MKLIKANLAAEAEQHLHGVLLLVLQQCQPQRVAGGVATDCLSILPAPDTAPQGATWQQHQLYARSAPPAFLQQKKFEPPNGGPKFVKQLCLARLV